MGILLRRKGEKAGVTLGSDVMETRKKLRPITILSALLGHDTPYH